MRPDGSRLRRGDQYERWVRTHAAALCATIGVDMRSARVSREYRFVGELNYRIDIWLETDRDIVLIECKDTVPTPDQMLYLNYQVRDVARARPEQTVHGIMLTTHEPTVPSRAAIAIDLCGLDRLHGDSCVELFVLKPEALAGSVLLWRLEGANTTALVVRRGRRLQEIEDIEQALQDPSSAQRLPASLDVFARTDSSDSMRLAAALIAAHDFLHHGSGLEARNFGREALRLSGSVGSTHAQEAAAIVTAAAEYRMALSTRRARR
jgi:hypothetical protein